jgi:hypothetical protein
MLSFTSPEKEKYFFYIYDMITSPEKGKRSTIHYSTVLANVGAHVGAHVGATQGGIQRALGMQQR